MIKEPDIFQTRRAMYLSSARCCLLLANRFWGLALYDVTDKDERALVMGIGALIDKTEMKIIRYLKFYNSAVCKLQDE